MIRREEYSSKLKSGLLINPDSPYVKDEEYFRRKAEYIYGVYCSDMAGVLYGGGNSRRSYRELRDHARGLQSTERYKDILDPMNAKTKKRRWNISWDTVKFLNKFKAIIKDKMTGMRLIPHTISNDETARHEKDLMANKMRIAVNPKMKEFLGSLPFEASVQKSVEGLDNQADVDFFINMGGLRLGVEIAMKDAVDATISESGYEEGLVDMIADDIIDLNAAGLHVYYDEGVGKIMWEYIDPATTVIASSTYEDFRDADFSGFIKRRTVEELRKVAGFDQKILDNIGNTYSTYNGISYSQWAYGGDGRRENYVGQRSFDTFGVEVMTVYWVDGQHFRHIEGTHKMGNTIFDPISEDSKLSKKDEKRGKKIVENIVQHVYKCNWVVGTPYIYGYGINDIVVRQGVRGNKKAILPIIFYKGQEPSIIEKAIPFNDEIQIATYKIRHLKAKIPPGPRMAIDKTKMADSVQLGGERYNWLDLFEIYNATGVLMYESQGDYSVPGLDYSPAYVKPIDFIPSGIAEDFQLFSAEIMRGVEGIRQVTGVNPISDGTNQNPDLLKGVMEGMMEATNSALRPDIKKIVNIFKKSCYVTMLKYQHGFVTGLIDPSVIPMSQEVRMMMDDLKVLNDYNWNIDVEIQTPEQRQQMMADLMRYQNFIPLEVIFSIKNMILNGDLRKAELILSKAVNTAKQEEHRMKMEVTQSQAMAQGQAAQMTEQERRATQQAKLQGDMQLLTAKAEIELNRMKEEFILEIQKIREKGEIDKDVKTMVVKENLKQTI